MIYNYDINASVNFHQVEQFTQLMEISIITKSDSQWIDLRNTSSGYYVFPNPNIQ